jgi:hypothetical protein
MLTPLFQYFFPKNTFTKEVRKAMSADREKRIKEKLSLRSVKGWVTRKNKKDVH